MRAFVSGEAGTAVIVGVAPTIRSVFGDVTTPWHAGDALRVFEKNDDLFHLRFA